MTEEIPSGEPYEKSLPLEEESSFEEFHLGEDDYELRPDVRWIRYRPPMGPIVRWGLVALVLMIVFIS